jgi:molybdenum cofactor cytidylyltransferase
MIAGVLLAAGQSKRMGGASKLLLPLRGKPLVRWAGEALAGAGFDPLVAVLGRNAVQVREALEGLGFQFVENAKFAEGMATSIVAGILELPDGCRGAGLVLGDMPRVRSESIRGLARVFEDGRRGIVVPVYGGRRGHPVLFDLRKYREELLALGGDEGARSLLARHPEDVLEFPVEDAGVVMDIDSPDDYAEATKLI